MTPRFLDTPSGARIAYGRRIGESPVVVFLGGFRSDMGGIKASTLDTWCEQRGQGFLRFDYQGHGASDGEFEDCDIQVWANDAIETIGALTSGPLVLVGSSMGGWIMSLVARQMPERIAGLVGIAAAPDFTSELLWPSFSEQDQQKLQRDGVLYVPSQYDSSPYPITLKMIEVGEECKVLTAPVPVSCPVRLVHGLEDPDVPWQMSRRLQDQMASDDVTVTLIKDGDHRLSKPHELATILRCLDELLSR